MSEIANEIPTEASIDAPAAAPLAPVVDAPTECSADASAGSNAAAGDGPAIPRRAKHDRGRSANYTLKSLEESECVTDLRKRIHLFSVKFIEN